MIPPERLIHRITWIEPGSTTDRYHNTVDDWSDDAVTTHDDVPAFIDRGQTVERIDGRDVIVTTLTMMTNELGIKGRHRIVWLGDTYEVDGDPATGWTTEGANHLESRLRIAEG